MVQLPSTLLADLDLPELEEETVSGSLGGQVVSAGGASKAAADIERAAAQVGNPTECQTSTVGFVVTAAAPQVGVLPTQSIGRAAAQVPFHKSLQRRNG